MSIQSHIVLHLMITRCGPGSPAGDIAVHNRRIYPTQTKPEGPTPGSSSIGLAYPGAIATWFGHLQQSYFTCRCNSTLSCLLRPERRAHRGFCGNRPVRWRRRFGSSLCCLPPLAPVFSGQSEPGRDRARWVLQYGPAPGK